MIVLQIYSDFIFFLGLLLVHRYYYVNNYLYIIYATYLDLALDTHGGVKTNLLIHCLFAQNIECSEVTLTSEKCTFWKRQFFQREI